MAYSDIDLDEDVVDIAEFSDEESGVAEYPEIDFESLGIDPASPTLAKPGSEEKVCMLAARYAAGLPLWHDSDCVDHGPGGAEED